MAIKEQLRMSTPYAGGSVGTAAGVTHTVQIGATTLRGMLKRYAYLTVTVSGGFVAPGDYKVAFRSGYLSLAPSAFRAGSAGSVVLPMAPSGLSSSAPGNSWLVYPRQLSLGDLVTSAGWSGDITLTLAVVLHNSDTASHTTDWAGGAFDVMWRLYESADFVPII